MSQLKVLTCLGTRPEIIRLAPTLCRLDKMVNHVLVHTGQNWDYKLNEVFFEELGLRPPDYFLGVDPSSLGSVLGNILIEIEKVLRKEKPDAFLVLGDTNSSIAALMAKRMRIPVYHMEAGNRCFDANVPEEVNRKMIDHIADFNLCYTEHARRNLLAEGLEARRIYVTGSPLFEVFAKHKSGIDDSEVLSTLGLEAGKYFLLSMHREENVDSPKRLRQLLCMLEELYQSYSMPIVVSTHPRTQKRLDALDKKLQGDIRFLEPFGWFDYNRLQRDSTCVLSDSGTIAEESALLGFPAVTLRQSIERPEAMDTGTLIVAGFDAENVLEAVAATSLQHQQDEQAPVPADYQIPNTSQRVVQLILGTARQHWAWSNLQLPTGSTRDA